MKTRQFTEIPKCDFCGEPARYDTSFGGSWAYYCVDCATSHSGKTQEEVEKSGLGTILEPKAPMEVDNSNAPLVVVELITEDGEDWYATCPTCGYKHSLEPDAFGQLRCHGCKQPLEVVSMWC